MSRMGRIRALKPNPHSVQARLPEVYKKYCQSLKLEPAAVHYIPENAKWKFDPESKQKVRVENRSIPLKFPKEADEGIWGGEGVIQGFIKEKKKRRRFPNFWIPKLKRTVVYSEILNQYMSVIVTERTLRLIDQNYGFDNYILSTPVQDLKSQLALSIRRKLLLALVNGENYHEDDNTNREVFEKYKKYMVSKEEAEWFGLTMREAVQKQKLLEEEQNQPVPLKHQLRLKLIEELKRKEAGGEEQEKQGEDESDEKESANRSWLSKLNPFGKKEN